MTSFLLLFLLGGLAAAGSIAASSGGASSGATVDPDPDPTSDPDPAQPVDTGGTTGSSGMVPVLADSAYDIGWAGISEEEQLIVELINRARMDPASEVNRLSEPLASGISSSPVEALAVVPTLSEASDTHSQDMDDRDFFSHTDPDGGLPWDRAAAAGHETTYVGENIGWIGSSSTSFDAQDRAEAHHSNLWHSDGHQANLMSGNWDQIGVGYDYGDYRGYDGSAFVTEMFSNTGDTYLTGVVIEDADGDRFYDLGEGQGEVKITAWDGTNAYATATWDSGGYTLELPAGTYTVRFEGGELDAPYETQVTIGGENVKLDVMDSGGNAAASVTVSDSTGTRTIPMVSVTDVFPEGYDPTQDEDDPELMFA